MYLVSACLAGFNCRYDGRSNENKTVIDLVKQGKAVPVCPEQLAGLHTPRVSCEIQMQNRRVISKDGRDLTEEFVNGAERTLAIAQALNIKKAILKAKSPSCGCGEIYDGSFSGKLVEGNGLTAELLIKNGIEVCTEMQIDKKPQSL